MLVKKKLSLVDIKDTLGAVSKSALVSLDLQQTSGWIVDVNVTIILGTARFVLGFARFEFLTARKRFRTEKDVFYTRRPRPNPFELVTLTNSFFFN